jgi:1-acyl-sn-glycerol-3-phosphate acyltransferase
MMTPSRSALSLQDAHPVPLKLIIDKVWKIRSVVFTAPAIIFLTVGMACVSLVCSLWDRTGNTQHRLAQVWSRMLLAVGFVRCKVTGAGKLDPSASYVLVSNHSSYMDTPAIVSSIPLQFRFLAKKGLFSIPFLGWHLGRAGHIPVQRDDPRASVKTMSEAARIVHQRCVSLLLFPEGGRSLKDMRRFKEGAAYIAIKAGVPVVPIGIVNARVVLPMHHWVVRPGVIEINVGEPIPTEGMTARDRGSLNEVLEEKVAELARERIVTSASA